MSRVGKVNSTMIVVGSLVVIVLIALVGFMLWQSSQQQVNENTLDETETISTSEAGTKVFTSAAHNISFTYPSSWSVSEKIPENEVTNYHSTVTIANSEGEKVAFLRTALQVGGGCPADEPLETVEVLANDPATLEGLDGVHVGVVALQRQSGEYSLAYGINKGTYKEGSVQVRCPRFVNYDFMHELPVPVRSVMFGVWASEGEQNSAEDGYRAKTFATIDDAKKYLTSDEYIQIERMITSLSIK